MSSEEASRLLAEALGENEKYKTDDDRKHEEIVSKKKAIDEFNINSKYEAMVRSKERAAVLENTNIDVDSSTYKQTIIDRNTEYLQNARNSGIFLDKQFKALVPYFAKNTILIGAQSGNGKSTIAANLAYNALKNKQRVLIITNEEAEEDFYNRVACLFKGWHYTNHDKFSDEQLAFFNKNISILSERMMVISDVWQDREGTTTTLEGMVGTFNSIKQSKQKFDVIIVDYYQGLSTSIINPTLADWQVQQEFSTYLNGFVKSYPHGPVIILSQLKPNDEDFKNRIEGRKAIYNRCTCAIEVKPNFELRCSEFHFHKARHNQAVGKHLKMGYDRGLFVPYTDDFRLKASMDKQKEVVANNMAEIKPGGLNGNDEKKD